MPLKDELSRLVAQRADEMGITAVRLAQITASGPPPYRAPPIKSLQQQPRAAATAERSDFLVETLVDRGTLTRRCW